MTNLIATLVSLIGVCVSIWAATHVVLTKRDARAAAAWVGLIWMLPLVGPGLYLWLGINRIQRKARSLRASTIVMAGPRTSESITNDLLSASLDPSHQHLIGLMRLITRVTGTTLTAGNKITPFTSGDDAYASMLAAIANAESTIAFSTYIFDSDDAGILFRDALSDAVKRGVQVRVLIDAIGTRYSWPSPVRRLRQAGVPVAEFNPTYIPWRFQYSNLRNHRKLMIVDGMIGYTGGMNIRGECLLKRCPSNPIQDLHFRIDGPVVSHMQCTFVEDWNFATGEELSGDQWFPRIDACGNMLARGIADGPDESLDQLRLSLLGALDCSVKSVKIVTPYFLPDENLISALSVAAMRGVEIDILIPEQTNLRLVQWSMMATVDQVLERSCRVWASPPPFDHSKLVIVDDLWVLLGSSNWDARSLRLNFEFNIECYSRELAGNLSEWFEMKRSKSRALELDSFLKSTFFIRLRNGIARLATPYL